MSRNAGRPTWIPIVLAAISIGMGFLVLFGLITVETGPIAPVLPGYEAAPVDIGIWFLFIFGVAAALAIFLWMWVRGKRRRH